MKSELLFLVALIFVASHAYAIGACKYMIVSGSNGDVITIDCSQDSSPNLESSDQGYPYIAADTNKLNGSSVNHDQR